MSSDKDDIKKLLDACRKSGPMDEKLVRGSQRATTQNKDTYYADATYGTKYLRFSCDEDENSKKKS